MGKAVGHVSAVLKGVLFIGVSIQTVLGIVWMYCNFSHVPQFGDSLFYLQLSRTLRCDEYTGILYPLFLRAVGRNHYAVYVIQLIAAYAAASRFLRVIRPMGKWRRVWGSLALLTVPVVMQCHLAMLPCSFAASFLLLELSLLTEAVRDRGRRTLKKLAELCLCWLALGLLLPEYLYLGAVPVLLFCLCSQRQLRQHKGRMAYGVLLIAAFMGMLVGIHSLTQTRGLYGRADKTLLTILTQRIAWTSLLEEYEGWWMLVPEGVDRRVVTESARNADGMDRGLFPAMERAVADGLVTEQQAEEYYKLVIGAAWRWHKPWILKEIAWDIFGYGASPAILQCFLGGRGYDSYTGRNYDFFLEHTPGLSKQYMDYGSWWFAAALALTAALQILELTGSTAVEKKETAKCVLCCLVMAGVMVLWYTMGGAGMLDYKNTAVIPQLWMAWTALAPQTQGMGSGGRNIRGEQSE